jgi:hypothetical protein
MKTKLTLSLFTRFKTYVSNLWFKYVKNPFYYRLIVEPKAKREKEKKRKEIIKNFEVNQKTLQSRVKEIMYHEKVYCENNPKLDYLNQKLVEGREHIIEISPAMKRIPFLYDPEIVQIHNEHLTRNGLTLGEIKAIENMRAEDSLKKQAKTIGGYLELKIDKFFKSPRMNYLLNKPFKDLTLIEIRELKHEKGRARLTELEKDLAFMGVEKFFDGTDISDAEFPADQNIDDFPIIKKILGKGQK